MKAGLVEHDEDRDDADDLDHLDDLIGGCRLRDSVAQHRLFHMYWGRVYSMALYLCRNPADADEIAQDVFVKVFRHLDRFLGDSKFETWLYRVVANAASDHRRKERRRALREGLVRWFHGRPPSFVETPSRSQAEEAVRAAVASLPKRFRLCVVLRYVDDLSYDEIAAVLKCPPGTVAARLSRAHRLLAMKLARLKR